MVTNTGSLGVTYSAWCFLYKSTLLAFINPPRVARTAKPKMLDGENDSSAGRFVSDASHRRRRVWVSGRQVSGFGFQESGVRNQVSGVGFREKSGDIGASMANASAWRLFVVGS
jgi:hypothetical protein